MRIVINYTAASSGGSITILKDFYNYLILSEKAKEHEWIFLLGEKHITETDNIKVIVLEYAKKSWINRLKFDFFSGKNIVMNFDPDIIMSLQNTILMGVNIPQVLYMHQSIPFQKEKSFSFFKKDERKLAVYQNIIGKLIKVSIKKADFVIVQTKWIKQAVIKATNISRNNIECILPPTKSIIDFKKEITFDKSSFFYPADAYIYKNHQCIYEASKILNKKGITDFQITLTINNETTSKNIEWVGSMAFDKVIDKYNTSTLIFPSYIETVGLPLLEAREMGSIILAANCDYAKEVLYDYENVYFFNPYEPEELAILIEKVKNGEILKKITKKSIRKTENTWGQVLDILLKQGGREI